MTKKYLLLIDDDPDEFDFFLDAINKLQGLFECSYAVSAEAAYELLKEYKPDYIFVDMNMPKINGLECIATILDRNLAPQVPLFVYSTSADPLMQQRAMHLGASGCYKKSGHPNALVEILRSLYEQN
jgi:DNA-binding NarL/FixJ family response regulator